jgi:hypothetical protein
MSYNIFHVVKIVNFIRSPEYGDDLYYSEVLWKINIGLIVVSMQLYNYSNESAEPMFQMEFINIQYHDELKAKLKEWNLLNSYKGFPAGVYPN